MLDVLYIDDIFGTSSFDDTIVSAYGTAAFNINSNFMDSNGLIDKLSNYSRYCQTTWVSSISYGNAYNGTNLISAYSDGGCGSMIGAKVNKYDNYTTQWLPAGTSVSARANDGTSYYSTFDMASSCVSHPGKTYSSSTEYSTPYTVGCGGYGSRTWYK